MPVNTVAIMSSNSLAALGDLVLIGAPFLAAGLAYKLWRARQLVVQLQAQLATLRDGAP